MVYVVVKKGQTASLNCFASGNPRPTIEWSKGSQAVVHDGRKYVSNQEGKLQINNSQIDDAGQYQCLAANRGGESAKNLTVYVLCKFDQKISDCVVTSIVPFFLSCICL